jgi:hypothetical protein
MANVVIWPERNASDVRRETDWAVAACFFRALVVFGSCWFKPSPHGRVPHVEFFAPQLVGRRRLDALTVKKTADKAAFLLAGFGVQVSEDWVVRLEAGTTERHHAS